MNVNLLFLSNALSNIKPPILLATEINQDLKNAKDFFENKNPLPILINKNENFGLNNSGFGLGTGSEDEDEDEEETQSVDILFSGKNSNSENLWKQLYNAFRSKSVDSFKKCFIDHEIINIKKKDKNDIKPILLAICNYIYLPSNVIGFYPNAQTRGKIIEINYKNLASTTAFAVSASQIFIGDNAGEVISYVVDFSNPELSLDKDRVIFAANSGNKKGPYSILYLNNMVLQIFEKDIKGYDLETREEFFYNEVEFLKYPAVTDGCQIYSYDGIDKVNIFQFECINSCSSNKSCPSFHMINTVHLSQNPINSGNNQYLMNTNGSIITFGKKENSGKEYEYEYDMFSILTGRFLKKKKIIYSKEIFAWTFSSLSVSANNFILSGSFIQILEGVSVTPRWLIGYLLPNNTNQCENNMIDAIERAVYEGASFFSKGDCSLYQQIFIHIFESENIALIKAISILFVNHSDQSDEVLCFLNKNGYEKARKMSLTKLILYVFLSSLSKSSSSFTENNYVTYYIEKEDSLDLIFFVFYQYFNFVKIPLTNLATEKLASYVFSNANEFPNESMSILSFYCENYVSCRFNIEYFHQIQNVMKTVFDCVIKNIDQVINKEITPKKFRTSTTFILWQFYIHQIAMHKDIWLNYISNFLDLLEFSMLKYSDDIKDMLINTLIVYLEMISILPYGNPYIRFDSIDTFYNRYQHPLNGKYRELDTQILGTLNDLFDIEDESKFADLLFILRRSIIFNKNKKTEISDFIVSEQDFKFIIIDNFKYVFPFNNIEFCNKFFTVFHENCYKMNPNQLFIFKLYSKHFVKLVNAMGNENTEKVKSLLTVLFPFSFPYNKLYNISITLKSILEIDGNDLESNEEKLLEIYNIEKGFFAEIIDFMKTGIKKEIDLQDHPQFYSMWVLFYIALKNGLINDIECFRDIFIKHIIHGSSLIIKMIMKCLTYIENTGKIDLTFIFKILYNLLNSYFSEKVNPFPNQQIPSNVSESIFIIIQYMKEMFNSNSGKFREFLLKKVSIIKTAKKALPIFAILNNSIEVLRVGVEVNYLNKSLELIKGRVVSLNQENTTLVTIVIKNWAKEEKEITEDLSKCSSIWCSCPTTVYIELIQDIKPFVHLFFGLPTISSDDSDALVSQTFKYASLLDFVSSANILDLMTHKQKNEIIYKNEWPLAFCPEHHFYDFGNLMALRTKKIPIFSFTDAESSIEQILITDNTKSGKLAALTESKIFVSSPIHPTCKIDIILKYHLKTPKKTPIRIKIFALALPYNTILNSNEIEFSSLAKDSSNESQQQIMIQFLPEKGGFNVLENGDLKILTFGSPSITLYYMTIELGSNNIVEYDAIVTNEKTEGSSVKLSKSFKFSAVKKDKTFMMVSESKKVRFPLNQSSLFNELSLKEASFNLVSAFRTLISIHHIRKSNYHYIPFSILRLLVSIDPYPTENALSLNDIRPVSHWKESSKFILDFVIEYVNYIGDDILFKMRDDIETMCNDSHWNDMCIKEGNKSALFIQKGSLFDASNCYLFSDDVNMPLTIVNYLNKPILFDHSAMIVPILRPFGSLVEIAIHMKHLLAVSVSLNSYHFDFLKKKIRTLERSSIYFKSMFKDINELINVINPKLPTDGFFPFNLNPISYLINESSVHENPNNYLLYSYCEYFGAKIENKDTIQINFEANEDKRVYFAIHDKKASSQRFEFEVNTSINMKSNSFIILEKVKKFTLKQVSNEQIESSALYFVKCEIPDIDKISNELKDWRPHHSHQLMCTMKSMERCDLSQYQHTPLSQEFGFETSKFVFHILSTAERTEKTCLYFLRCHLIMNDENKNYVISKCRPFEYYKEICDVSSLNHKRITFLKKHELFLFSLIDPNALRIENEIQLFSSLEKKLKKKIKNEMFSFIPNNIKSPENKKSYERLINVLKNCHVYVFLQFIEFCTGIWGIEWITDINKKVFVYFSTNLKELESYPSDGLLIVGVFKNKEQLSQLLLHKLQEFSDRQSVYF